MLAFRLFLPLMYSLDRMHREGIIHRDISPNNVCHLYNGTLKLMDFGSARYYAPGQNRNLSVIYKEGYTPIEQRSAGGQQGPYTDVYSLCATIYYCITGKAPVDALDRIQGMQLPAPSELGASIPPPLERTLMRGLSIYPAERCQNMWDLIGPVERELQGVMYASSQEEKPLPSVPKLDKELSGKEEAGDIKGEGHKAGKGGEKGKEKPPKGTPSGNGGGGILKGLGIGLLLLVAVGLGFGASYLLIGPEREAVDDGKNEKAQPVETEKAQEVETEEVQEVETEEVQEAETEEVQEVEAEIEEEGLEVEDHIDLSEAYSVLNGQNGKEKDEELAFSLFLEKANEGSPEAMNMVGTMYKHGTGISADMGRAVAWYRQAAEASYPAGMENLGQMYREGKGVEKDYSLARFWYEKAAELGNGDAQYALGLMCQDAKGGERDYEMAFSWFEKAAENVGSSVPDAKVELGKMYRDGITVPKDEEKAYALFEVAGTKAGLQCMAKMIGEGLGRERDLDAAKEIFLSFGTASAYTDLANCYRDAGEAQEAIAWYEKAIAKDYNRAYNNLADFYRDGYAGEPEYEKAVSLYEVAAKKDYSPSVNNLGIMYRDGLGVEQDLEKAIAYFQRAMRLGRHKAYYNMATLYLEGRGVGQDKQEAKRLYEIAAGYYFPDALTALGDMYRLGDGVETDLEMALSYYEKAMNQDFAAAYYG
ncbi:MAG: SEL1-like repeat protein, partial [Blautia sp.]|nr:SEL1-like repeat protein [Blautia sp.]